MVEKKKKNYGKEFERRVFEDFVRVQGVSIDRIPDQVTRYKGSSSNICDFIVYKEPTLLYLECKTVHGNTLPFSNIRTNQWDGMFKKSYIPGVRAGVLVWFIDKDITQFISISLLEYLRQCGKKSIRFDYTDKWLDEDEYIITIPAKKKRVMFEYDFSNFFSEI